MSQHCDVNYDGNKIDALRVAKGWSGAELARRAGISQPTLWAYLHGVTKQPKHDTLVRIAAALGVQLRDIMRPSRRGSADLLDDLAMVFDRLDNGNKQAILSAAQALLENQQKRK